MNVVIFRWRTVLRASYIDPHRNAFMFTVYHFVDYLIVKPICMARNHIEFLIPASEYAVFSDREWYLVSTPIMRRPIPVDVWLYALIRHKAGDYDRSQTPGTGNDFQEIMNDCARRAQ